MLRDGDNATGHAVCSSSKAEVLWPGMTPGAAVDLMGCRAYSLLETGFGHQLAWHAARIAAAFIPGHTGVPHSMKHTLFRSLLKLGHTTSSAAAASASHSGSGWEEHTNSSDGSESQTSFPIKGAGGAWVRKGSA